MGYTIFQFDGVTLPTYQLDGDTQDMGTGEALTSFMQLPSRGFYDNYGSTRSPQGVRPITKTCVLWGATSAALDTALDALRAKIGVRGKLTISMDNGDYRWQWARLVRVSTPRTSEAKGGFLPCELSFISAAQHWYGIIIGVSGWTWGDSTWVFGDGTVEFGEEGTSQTLSATGATFSGTTRTGDGTTQVLDADDNMTNDGNIDVTNMIITVTAGTNTITDIQWVNSTSGYTWIYTDDITTGNSLVVNMGAMTVTNNAVDAYSGFTPSNKATWDVLNPGDNTINVYVNGNAAADGTIAVEFYHHFA